MAAKYDYLLKRLRLKDGNGSTATAEALPMTTTERTAITPDAGVLIYDTDIETLFVGDGSTQGGVKVEGGGDDYTFSGEFTVTSAGGVSINAISASKITGKVDSAGVADALVDGATVGYALSAGTATTANGVTQAVKDDIISSAGGGSLDGEIATINEVMTGVTGGTTAVVDVSALRGALTAGQAVDVTSQPDGVTGNWKGTFNWTDLSLGFDNSFPKYADGLTYLLIADLEYIAIDGKHILVSPSGTWLDGTKTAIRIESGETKRVAMLFASRTAKLTFNLIDIAEDIEVSHLREYEVTACSNEAIAYIAGLDNPDAFADYYLVKTDMVQPWTYIIDMGTSPAVTIASGLSYKLNAATGTHQLTVDTCPAGYDGRDAIIRIRLGGTGVIQAVAPLQLGGALVPYAINNCVVRFRDGEAVLLVEDTLAGYVVTVNTGTDEGSLPYGLAAAGVPYIAFSPATDGIPVELSGATTAAEEVSVVGNGLTETVLNGSFTCTSKTTLANLTFSGSVVANGAIVLANGIYHIDSATGSAGLTLGSGAIIDLTGNSTPTPVAPGGGITFEKGGATVKVGNSTASSSYMLDNVALPAGAKLKNTAVVDLGSGNVAVSSGTTVSASGCTFSGGNATGYAGVFYVSKGAHLDLNGCELRGNTGAKGQVYTLDAIDMKNTVASASTGAQADVYVNSSGGIANFNGGCAIGYCRVDNGGTAVFSGSNTIRRIAPYHNTSAGRSGFVTISGGAIVDLTGNTNSTPIAPGGGITFKEGGATVYPSAGSAGAYTLGGVTLTALGNTNVISGGMATVTSDALIKDCAITGATVMIPTAATVSLLGTSVDVPLSGTIIVADGDGDASINLINSAGASVHINGGTYTSIAKDGTAS